AFRGAGRKQTKYLFSPLINWWWNPIILKLEIKKKTLNRRFWRRFKKKKTQNTHKTTQIPKNARPAPTNIFKKNKRRNQ
ncbi:hypothetical protein ACQWHW_24645, partial [Salmonella enterica subsp. enterica serovar Infantis]